MMRVKAMYEGPGSLHLQVTVRLYIILALQAIGSARTLGGQEPQEYAPSSGALLASDYPIESREYHGQRC
jgi:hypothetical protein